MNKYKSVCGILDHIPGSGKLHFVLFSFPALPAQKRKPRAGPVSTPHPIRAHLQKYFVKFFLHCNKSVLNLYPTNLLINTMTSTIITHKTGFRAVYLHEPHDGIAFEQQGNVIWETYDQAIANANSVCEDLSTTTWSITVKYIIAIPLVGQVEVEHINHTEL